MTVSWERYMEQGSGKVGAMIRHLMGDIGQEFKDDWGKLYGDEKGELNEVEQDCMMWHWMIGKYSPDPYMMRKFISVIQLCVEYGIKLSSIPEWKKMMRIILLEEYFAKIRTYTQVPQMAAMYDGHYTKKKEKDIIDASEVFW